MNNLQPKALFQANADLRKEFSNVSQSDNFKLVLSFALSEYVCRKTPSAEQLTAVRDFVDTLMNLALTEEKVPMFATKTLDHSIGKRQTP